MSQFCDAKREVAKIDDIIDRALLFDLSIAELRELVKMAQNKPPYGQGDGSIDERTWRALQTLVLRAEAFQTALDHALVCVSDSND